MRRGAPGLGLVLALVPCTGCLESNPDPDTSDETEATSDADTPDDGVADLVTPEAWTPVADSDDLFLDQRPADYQCDRLRGYYTEETSTGFIFEVDTMFCNSLKMTQPLLSDVQAGAELEVRVFHFELAADEPAEAYLGVALGGSVAWETRLPIPQPTSLVEDILLAPVDLPAGTPVQFHLNNHGDNAYRFVSLQRL